MNFIIFSKDRGCQLELLLRSIKKYFKEWKEYSINVLYTYSNDDFGKGYDITKKLHPEFNYKFEENFKIDLLSLIDENKKYTIFFVDDIVFKEKFSIDDDKVKLFDKDDNILCLSLRLHPNLTYCYPARVRMIKPPLDEYNRFKWIGKSGDYGYPMSLDGHLFRTSDIIDKFKKFNYYNPNTLESSLAMSPIRKPLMLMYDKSIIINNPANKVQNFNNNVYGNISAKFINDQYLNGKKISLKSYDGVDNISCHQEIDIIFE